MNIFIFQTTPGWMAGAWTEAGLKALALPQESPEAALEKLAAKLKARLSLLPAPAPAVGPAGTLVEEIEHYFSGVKVSFQTPVDWSGYTSFQRRVLEMVRTVPYGETITYGQLARESGSPRGARAVGGVMRANRTPLVIPCHRVLAAGGALGGFSGGIDFKKYLLTLKRHRGTVLR